MPKDLPILSKMIYVADDEKNIRNLIYSFLTQEGFEVKLFENGDNLYKAFLEKEPSLIILDVMMPGTDGFSVCSNIRKLSNVPIIILTSRETDADYITGFTLGCDDYFTKPFSPVMLVLRVKAILKRSSEIYPPVSQEELSFGDLTLNINQRTAICKKNKLNFTNTEFSLMQYILENKNRAISRDELLESIWGYTSDVETRVTDDNVKRIRKKLSEANSNVVIETIWGFGFKLEERGKNV